MDFPVDLTVERQFTAEHDLAKNVVVGALEFKILSPFRTQEGFKIDYFHQATESWQLLHSLQNTDIHPFFRVPMTELVITNKLRFRANVLCLGGGCAPGSLNVRLQACDNLYQGCACTDSTMEDSLVFAWAGDKYSDLLNQNDSATLYGEEEQVDKALEGVD